MARMLRDAHATAIRPSSMRHRQIFIHLILTLALITGCGRKIPSTAQEVVRLVRTMSVGVPTESRGRAFPGQAEANEEAELSFRVGGSLI